MRPSASMHAISHTSPLPHPVRLLVTEVGLRFLTDEIIEALRPKLEDFTLSDFVYGEYDEDDEDDEGNVMDSAERPGLRNKETNDGTMGENHDENSFEPLLAKDEKAPAASAIGAGKFSPRGNGSLSSSIKEHGNNRGGVDRNRTERGGADHRCASPETAALKEAAAAAEAEAIAAIAATKRPLKADEDEKRRRRRTVREA